MNARQKSNSVCDLINQKLIGELICSYTFTRNIFIRKDIHEKLAWLTVIIYFLRNIFCNTYTSIIDLQLRLCSYSVVKKNFFLAY